MGEERDVGEKLLAIVRKEFKLLDEPDIAQYITGLGRETIKAAGPQFFDYHFFIVNNKEFNAFAAPSGLIFVHSGLIETMKTEGELVSVIAHEIGHVASRHIADRIKKNTKISIGTAALVLAGIAIGGGPLSEALITGTLAADASMKLSFSRKDEEEADRLAFAWMKSQERNPAAMFSMLETMYRISKYRRGKLPPYLLSHPEPELRMHYIQDLLLSQAPRQYRRVNEFEFQRIKQRILTKCKDPLPLMQRYRKLISTDNKKDNKIMAHYGLSQLYLQNADYEKARQSLRKVMAIFPEEHILTTDMGVILFQAGKYEEALHRFQTAHAAAPDCLYTSFYLARALQQKGEPDKALRLYEEILPSLPDYSRLYYQIGQIKAARNNKAEGYYYLGIYSWYEGEPETAKLHLGQAIKNLPAGSRLSGKAKEMLEKIRKLEKM